MMERSSNANEELARLLERHIALDGTYETNIPGLSFIRASRVSEPVYSVYEPSLCVVAQGVKEVWLGKTRYRYDPESYLTASVHLPITGQVVRASPEEPYMCLRLQFDMNQILEVIQASGKARNPRREPGRGMVISRMNDSLQDAVLRLVRLLDSPRDIPVLAPSAIREILYRVLQGEKGAAIEPFALIGSHAQRIAKAIERLNRDYALAIRIEELAEEARMSASSLYSYFKEVTGMSPIQYQKRLRLQEARRLLLSGASEAATVAFQVGYESPSHFSREYSRLFGQPPIRDIRRWRQELQEEERAE